MSNYLKNWRQWIPWAITIVMAGWVIGGLREPKSKSAYDITEFAKLPVLLQGRIQPIDSVARNSLLMLRGKQSVIVPDAYDSSKTAQMPAIEWLLEAMTRPEKADTRQIFRIDNPELLGMLKLSETNKYFSFNEIKGSWEEIEKQASRIEGIEEQQRTPFEKQIMKLNFSMGLFFRLKNSIAAENAQEFTKELGQFSTIIKPGLAAIQAREAGKPYEEQDLQRVVAFFQRYERMSKVAYPLVIPPVDLTKGRQNWQSIGGALMESLRSGEINPAIWSYARMAEAYAQEKPAEFNEEVAKYKSWLADRYVPEVKKGVRETFYNVYAPFIKSISIYLLAFLFGCAYWFNWAKWTNRTSFYLLVLALIIHTSGLIFRMFLEGRPPVTNLYSSAIFVGWGAVVLGLILERFFKDGIGAVTASAVGVITLIIAHNLSLGGDTMEMLRAVLDTNFWLATHVVVITLGYASTFLAGFLAIIYVLRGMFTRTLAPKSAKSLSRMVYGIVCFATLFSFTGTILGGIWADQSWGRFWGWDPKENGALLIVIWCSVILHARWGGMIRERGLIVLALIGNIITAFSWFGVNMLGVGLHSYGFMDKAFYWLVAFDISQLALIGLALLPLKYWRSFSSPVVVHSPEPRETIKPTGLPKPSAA